MKFFFSIIIPYHNSSETIGRLLGSIQKSKKAPPYEVIVVDDGSTDRVIPGLTRDPATYRLDSRLRGNDKSTGFRLGGRKDKMSLRIIRLHKNMGPAVARNRGVAAARGKFIIFVDSDVELFPDALHNLWKIYLDDPDVVAVTGVWVKEQRSKAFFPNYKALRDWSYWINERDKSGYYFLFSTRIASIKKTVFQRLGGFDETYPAPLVEDIELTYRIARRYAIIFAPHVRVRHEFEGFWPVAKKYFLRAYYWTRLYARRKKFDPVATTLQEALTTISGVAVIFFLLMSLMSLMSPMSLMTVFLLHLFLTRKFLSFMVREKGIVFAIQGFFMGLILCCFIFAGAALGRLRQG